MVAVSKPCEFIDSWVALVNFVKLVETLGCVCNRSIVLLTIPFLLFYLRIFLLTCYTFAYDMPLIQRRLSAFPRLDH